MLEITLVKVFEIRGAAIDAGTDLAPQHEHGVRRAVIGTTGLIFRNPPTEFGEGHHQGSIPMARLEQVVAESGQPLADFLKQRGVADALVRVGVEAAQTDVVDAGGNTVHDHPRDQPQGLLECEGEVIVGAGIIGQGVLNATRQVERLVGDALDEVKGRVGGGLHVVEPS